MQSEVISFHFTVSKQHKTTKEYTQIRSGRISCQDVYINQLIIIIIFNQEDKSCLMRFGFNDHYVCYI